MHALYPQIVELVGRADALVGEFTFDPATLEKTFHIGVLDNGIFAGLNSFFKPFYTACPNSVLEFQQLDSRLFEKLTDGRLDAAILPETIKLPVKFHFQRLSLLKYCLIVGKNHPLERYYNKYKELPISEIEKYRKITITNQLSHENAFYLLDERILTGEAHQETGLALPFSTSSHRL